MTLFYWPEELLLIVRMILRSDILMLVGLGSLMGSDRLLLVSLRPMLRSNILLLIRLRTLLPNGLLLVRWCSNYRLRFWGPESLHVYRLQLDNLFIALRPWL